jgi:hypothetical protein
MPNFSAGLVRDFDLCKCNCKDCAVIQEKIARHCIQTKENDVALGFVRITAAESNNRLRGCIQRLLGHQPKNGKPDSDCIVACCHHCDRQVLEHNGIDNRTLVQETQKLELSKISGQDGRVKQLKARLPEKLAKALGHKEDSERCSCNRQCDDCNLFVQSPTAPRESVNFWALSLISDRSARRAHPSEQVTPATASPQRHGGLASPAMQPVKLDFKLSPKSVICLGLKNPFVAAFANKGSSKRGFVSQHFSFDHATDAWHSPLCSRSFQLQRQDLLDQRSSCKTDLQAVTMKKFQSTHLASTREASSPVSSQEQIEIILRQQFEHFGGRLDDFKECAVVQHCVRVIQDFHGGKGTIDLGGWMHEGAGGNKQRNLRPCLLKGDGCLLFRMLERQNQKLVGEGACASCQTRKRQNWNIQVFLRDMGA